MTSPLVHAPIRSMVCAGCSGPMQITKDACGNERLRCPVCQGVARPHRHPDDAMLPQGLVRADSVRVVRQIVRLPAPPPERVVELPAIQPGQLRCQVCAHGVDGDARFCADCQQVKDRARKREARSARRAPLTRRCLGCGRISTRAGGPKTTQRCRACQPTGPLISLVARVYRPKPCRGCRETFQPNGPRSEHCEACR